MSDDHRRQYRLRSPRTTPTATPRLADELGRSFAEYGFAIIRDHGIPADLIARAEEKSKQFFALPEEVKSNTSSKGRAARAATPRSGSRPPRARQSTTSRNSGTSAATCRRATRSATYMPHNVWPAEVPGFHDTFEELYATFDAAGLKVLSAIARYLGLDEDYFADTVRDGNSVHAPAALSAAERADGEHIRAGAHEDINTITLLLGAEEAGLELLTKDGRWLPVSPAGRAGGQHRRHAAAADQRPSALDHAPRGQPDPGAGGQCALLDAVLPPLPPRFPDRGAAGHGAARASSRNGRRSPRTTTSRSGCARSSSSSRRLGGGFILSSWQHI